MLPCSLSLEAIISLLLLRVLFSPPPSCLPTSFSSQPSLRLLQLYGNDTFMTRGPRGLCQACVDAEGTVFNVYL